MSRITMRENAAAPDAPESGKATIFVTDDESFLIRRSNGDVGVISASYQELSSTTSHGTTSTSYVALNNMSTTLSAGVYTAWFNASASISTTTATGYITLYINGVQQPETERLFHAHSTNSSHSHAVTHNISCFTKFTISANSTVEVRFKTSAGTLTVTNRNVLFHRGT